MEQTYLRQDQEFNEVLANQNTSNWKTCRKFDWLVAPTLIIIITLITAWMIYKSISASSETNPRVPMQLGAGYAKDSNHAYFNGVTLSTVTDPNTFQLVGGNYTKDAKHVYFEFFNDDHIVEGADPKTFVYLGGDLYGKDKNQAYFRAKPIPLADPDTFTLAGGLGFSKDARHVYWLYDSIPNADSKSFTVLGDFYAKDKARAYFQGHSFLVSDLKTLVHVWGATAKDSVHVYNYGKVAWGAEPVKCSVNTLLGCK